jgi:lysozyme
MPEQFKKASEMAWYRKCRNRIKESEGFRAKPYFDQKGYRTALYGRNIELKVMRVRPPSVNAEELIFALEHLDDPLAIGEKILDDDLGGEYLNLIAYFGGEYERPIMAEHDFDKLPDDCKIALCDMAYNMGFGGLMGFVNMLEAIDEKDWQTAYYECLDSEYARDSATKHRANKNAMLLLNCEEE